MRRSRQLTPSERWELGLFLALVVVGLLIITVFVKSQGNKGGAGGLPRIFAVDATELPGAVAGNDLQSVPMLEFGTPPPGRVSGISALASRALPPSAIQAAVTPAEPARAKLAKPQEPEIKIYNGKEYRYVKTIKLRVTAYAPDPRCTYPFDGTTTASGLSVKTNGGRLVAADTGVIPMYSLVTVPGYAGGAGVPVLDRGGAIKGNRLDVLLPTFEKAKAWGSRLIDVKIYRPVR